MNNKKTKAILISVINWVLRIDKDANNLRSEVNELQNHCRYLKSKLDNEE